MKITILIFVAAFIISCNSKHEQTKEVKVEGYTYADVTAQDSLLYKAWGKYPKDFKTISDWFKDDLLPLFMLHRGFKKEDADAFVEGVVFTHKDGRMAKLRRDMFDWFEGERHKEN